MNFYQNSFIPTCYPKGFENASVAGQNIPQIQCSPPFMIQPQGVPCLPIHVTVNTLSQQMPYQPYVMYTQVHPYPPLNQFNPMQYQYQNQACNSQPIIQMIPVNINQSSIMNIPQQNIEQCYQTQVKSESYYSPQKMNIHQQHQKNIYNENKLMQSEKTSQITDNNEQKYIQDKEFSTSPPQNQAQLKQKKKEQQNCSKINDIILTQPIQQNSKQTSEIILKPQVQYGISKVSSVQIDITHKDQNQNVKYTPNQEAKKIIKENNNNNNQQGQVIFKLSSKEVSILKQLSEVNIQNAFKNILKGFTQHVNIYFEHIYVYEYEGEGEGKKYDEESMNIKRIDNPSQQQKKIFIQKFNKFIKNKKYNNTSIKQIIENKLYSSVLKDYIVNYSPEWIKKSSFQSKEDIIVVLEFFRMCCDNPNLLLFLSKQNDKLIPTPSDQDQIE